MNTKTFGARGVTLIMVAGVLTLLAALAAGFYTLAMMQSRSAIHSSDAVRAELMAQSGIVDALARLREQASEKTEDPTDAWYTVDWRNSAARRISYAQKDFDAPGATFKPYSRAISSSAEPKSDHYILEITDSASKININACDNLAVVLDNLCRVIGPPLVAADLDSLQPARWAREGAEGYDSNSKDSPTNRDLYYAVDPSGYPLNTKADGSALYGDGYAIAAFRSRLPSGRFTDVGDVKNALTVIRRPDHPELELLEREVKFAAIKNYITIDSWVDTNTVCVGKFEWISGKVAIDRDKSWVADDPADKLNHRGSLRGSYVSILNGHGAGQLRRIKTNGIDWIEVEQAFTIEPGPVSSYMILPKMDAKPDPFDPNNGVAPDRLDFKPLGDLQDDPDIDYRRYPLCIHRAPVNINTASDKVLEALFLGINIQHGHPMAIGAQSDRQRFRNAWYKQDFVQFNPDGHDQEYILQTLLGTKRVPMDTGKLTLDCKLADQPGIKSVLTSFGYLNNFGEYTSSNNFVPANGDMTEAHELAYRVIQARQRSIGKDGLPIVATATDPDPVTADADTGFAGYERGPFKSWDDLFFRVVRPWDDIRSYGDPTFQGRRTIPYSGKPGVVKSKNKFSIARMIMAHFNSNTDLLKFNPNIEWIDRWGRNFTELEPVMDYNGDLPRWVPGDGKHMWPYQSNTTKLEDKIYKGAYYVRTYRYKSDEMIDKSDLNRSTTEFCFHSNGVYEVKSTGQVVKNEAILAEHQMRAVAKVYDVWHETTQAQFARGRFEAPGGIGAPGTSSSGSVTRDGFNRTDRLPLTTMPEPLVPVAYKLKATRNADVVDTGNPNGRDCFGENAKPSGMPDAVANRILPALYDGQIVLATNTLDSQADGCAFLASFNGDLDTNTCKGNGREQAKTPANCAFRVVDTIGLLGALNDTQIDFDPVESDPTAASKLSASSFNVFTTANTSAALKRLDESKYWHNATCRQGDLRSDGVWLGNAGASGKDATLKYTIKDNYDPDDANGSTVFMWYKPTWHGTDHREHEFFNATRPGRGLQSRQHMLTKYGRFSCSLDDAYDGDGSSLGRASDCCLCFVTDGLDAAGQKDDHDWQGYLHGGFWKVPYTPGKSFIRESPSFHVQPFRWGSVGGISKPHAVVSKVSPSNAGWWYSTSSFATRDEFIQKAIRPFIDSQREPEGPAWTAQYFWKYADVATLNVSDIANSGSSGGSNPQPAAWPWCDGASKTPVFSINNLNGSRDNWIYRSTPGDGTCAVIDELKLCNTAWDTTRIYKEQTTCRYYTPGDPSKKGECPIFTSQTLYESLRGPQTIASTEYITPVSVTWTGFTPRFLHDNKTQMGTRAEVYKGSVKNQGKFRGPFDYIQYNLDVFAYVADAEGQPNEGSRNTPVMLPKISVSPLGVERPSPADYRGFVHKNDTGQPHYSRGFQIELLDNGAVIDGKTFDDPEEYNTIGSHLAPHRMKVQNLRYRVRFRYRIDDLVAEASKNSSGDSNVDPSKHITLDTPVFDDISIKYLPDRIQYFSLRTITE